MPLSEHEQRVLRQIERQFQGERGLVGSLEEQPSPADDARSAKRSAAGFGLGLVALLVSFASSWVVGVIGFVAMVVCAVRFVRALRRLLEARIAELSSGPVATGGGRGGAGGGALLSQLREALWGPVPGPTGRSGASGVSDVRHREGRPNQGRPTRGRPADGDGWRSDGWPADGWHRRAGDAGGEPDDGQGEAGPPWDR